MSEDIPPNKRMESTQLVPGKKLIFTGRGENTTARAQGNGSHSSSSSSTESRREEPERTSTGDGAGSVAEITPDEGVQLHRSSTVFGDIVSHSLSYTMGGRQRSALPSTSGSGREHAGTAKAAKAGVAINLAGEYSQDTQAVAAAATAADGNDAPAKYGDSRKRVMLGGNGTPPTGEGTGMLPPIVSASATSLKRRELSEDLCKEQRDVLDLVLQGKSVFFTGAAGTGKTFLLKRLHKALDFIGKGETTFMTGTTGKAAVGIGGCTVHSFAGIGLGNQSVSDTVSRVMSNSPVSSRWRTCHVLVIDEISMMEADLFDKLNLVGQRVRGNPQPFGGVQLVLCGDFYQLPPIGIGRGSVRFCFEAKTWNTSLDQSIVLKKVFRQNDPLFVKILHDMREGRVSPEAQRILSQKVEQARQQARTESAKTAGGAESTTSIESSEKGVHEEGGGSCDGSSGVGEGRGPSHTLLFSRNEDVDRLNERELRKLPGEPAFYKARDSGEPAYLRQLQRNCAAPTVLELKEGAKVMLVKNINISKQLVNGRTGVIIKIRNEWGQRSPIVEFDTLEGNGTDKLQATIQHEKWTITLGKREVAKRVQLPLRLAWALSVHKSQGMTIANVMVSMQGMFEFGQAYVALSRATTLDGLHLLDFRLGVVRAHDKVKAFYAALEAAPKPGERMPSRSPSLDTGRESMCSPLVEAKGGPDIGNKGGMSPAARERMEANRIRAMAKLAEKRAKLRLVGEEA